MSSWSIAVKTVGQSDFPSPDFVIQVQPDDDITTLYDQIEEFTGLKASQQRLIYRGRIIRGADNECDSVKNEPKVKDVVGLADGQTIHLVPRPEPPGVAAVTPERSQVEPPDASDASMPTRTRLAEAAESSSSAALLAALLGLGNVDDEDTNDENLSVGQQLARLRSARIRNRSRRPNHRLTQFDLEVPDPGSMEPVRQGLMTLHTLLEGNSCNPNSGRQFYRGQWIDCRDTVNQWLEATVVEVLKPHEILPRQVMNNPRDRNLGPSYPTTDPAVSANDYEGRMRLLLEPADESPLDFECRFYKQRGNNEGVHLLLVHYNGWPHRWDEWIRSDSERIRPFRTRTRHPNTSPTACPTPQSQFNSSPPTNIKSEDDSRDRAALLPELHRIFSVVNHQMQRIVETENLGEPSRNTNSDVPWLTGGIGNDLPGLTSDSVDDIDRPFFEDEAGSVSRYEGFSKDHGGTNIGSITHDQALKKKLQELVPLLDRLGRALIDSAPHLSAYAASLPDEPIPEPERTAPGESNIVYFDLDEEDEAGQSPDVRAAGSLFSLMPAGGTDDPGSASSPSHIPEIDEDVHREPDYVDFVNASVNTTRGDIRNRTGRSSSDEAGLLGAYLAAASLSSLTNDEDIEGNSNVSGLAGLSRLLRQREVGTMGGGGGIDIHIHAIVTGPTIGGAGFALLGDPQIAAPRPALFSSHSRRSGITETRIPVAAPIDDEELGIFADLYSENPSPVDLRNGVLPAEVTPAENFTTRPLDEIESLIESLTSEGHVLSRPGRPFQQSRSTRTRTIALPPPQPPRRYGTISRLFRRLSRRTNGNRPFQGLS